MKEERHSKGVSFELALGIQIEFQEEEMEKRIRQVGDCELSAFLPTGHPIEHLRSEA